MLLICLVLVYASGHQMQEKMFDICFIFSGRQFPEQIQIYQNKIQIKILQ